MTSSVTYNEGTPDAWWGALVCEYFVNPPHEKVKAVITPLTCTSFRIHYYPFSRRYII
jgi:hypothetical protein